MKRLLIAAAIMCAASNADAQTFGTFQPSIDYFSVQRPDTPGDPRTTYTGFPVKASDVLAAAAAANQGASSAALADIAGRLDRVRDRFREGIALAGAINVLPPEPGRKLNISFGGAGYDGAGAASIAISARISENTIGYVGVAQGPTQTLVKGGFGWSPW